MRASTSPAPIVLIGLFCLAMNTSAEPGEGTGCATYGTAVEFVKSPSEAATRARKEQKLVFILHVSGHFEDPKFT